MNTKSSNPARMGKPATLALAVLAALSATNGASAAPAIGTLAAPTHLSRGDAVLGALPMATPMQVVVGLKLRDRAGLEAFVKEGAEAVASGNTPELMSDDEALANHAPTQAQAQAVADYLTARGFRNVTISPSRMLVSADGTAQTARDAFMTSFAQVRTKDGRFAYANTDAVHLPAALAGTVDSVLGLQDVHVPRSFAVRAGSGGVHTMDAVGHSPADFQAIYLGYNTAPTPTPVGIVTEGNITQVKTDLNLFTANNGLPTVTTLTSNVNGWSSNTSHVEAWDLASQDIVGMSGGVQKLIFYNIPSLTNANLTADYDTIVTKDAVKIIEASVGECETDTAPSSGDGSAATDDAIFELAALQGQTFAVATGDTGADECGNGTNTPSYPASSPWVVAVAGTHLNTSGAAETTWVSESAWTDSGGSASTFEPIPAWQAQYDPDIAHRIPGDKRVAADVAFDADPNTGAKIYVKGALGQYGGTGLSASLFAGLWARVLQPHPGLGFAAPMLYRLGNSSDFHDVSTGNNSGGESGIGYNAGLEYDFATGLGSLEIFKAINDMAGLSTQLIRQSGFEGNVGEVWAGPSSIFINNAKNAHGGDYYVSMGVNTSRHVELGQRVVLPHQKTLASLQFWLKIVTRDTGTTAKDTLSVDVYNEQNALIGHLGTFSNLDASSGYVQRGFDMSPYLEQTIKIRFTAINDSTLPTTFCLDDVTLTVE